MLLKGHQVLASIQAGPWKCPNCGTVSSRGRLTKRMPPSRESTGKLSEKVKRFTDVFEQMMDDDELIA